MKRLTIRIISIAFAIAMGAGLLSACGNGGSGGQNPVVTITMENGKKIVLELYPDKAPNTVNNFIYVIGQGYLNGTIFHRVSPTFMIQGGDMQSGSLGYSIKGEFSENGFAQNDIKHVRGVISMARTTDPDSATTQFFIMTATNISSQSLDGKYAAFGMVTEGMDVVDEIANSEWSMAYGDGTGMPATDQVMASVSVETFGVNYSEPKK